MRLSWLHRGTILAAVTALSTTTLVALANPASARDNGPLPKAQRDTLMQYAVDTWRSFEAMVDPNTGLVADNISGDLNPATRSRYTSPTNIGGYIWSTLVARDLGIIDRQEAFERIAQTLESVAELERHEQSGQFYNWYDPQTGELLRVWPDDGSTVYPFASSVDNGWLAAALIMVAKAEPRLRDEAMAIYEPMDFGFYYDPNAKADVGLIRGGFWVEPPPGCSTAGNYRGGENVFYTCHHYGAFNTEPRIASYIGIAEGDIPAEHYFGPWRTFPADNCDWSWSEQGGIGEWREYMGVDVWEGAYLAGNGSYLVPTWGGSMFEALMPDLFVPEAEWGPTSWGVNHPLFVQAQIHHGMVEADYGYWGFSPSSNPAGGYREYGVDLIGMDAAGYSSDQERTTVDIGFTTVDGTVCRPAQPLPTDYGDGVVTPHAAFLALPYATDAALANLAKLRQNFDIYGPGGFYDAVAVESGTVAKRYLSLDQAMIMAAIGNALRHDMIKQYFVTEDLRKTLRPMMRMEDFLARPAGN